MKYFDIHVSFGFDNGYSIFVKGNNMDEDKALDYAVENNKFTEEGDEEYIDYINEIDEDEYNEITQRYA